MTAVSAGPLPVPDSFPVTWEQPGDDQLFWFRDVMHYPLPMTPLTTTFMFPAFNIGASCAFDRLSMPLQALRYQALNGWTYLTGIPFLGTPEEMEARLDTMKRNVMALMPSFMEEFQRTYIPRIVAIAESFRRGDVEGKSAPELARWVADQRETLVELWDIHMQLNIPPVAAVFGLDEFLQAVLGDEGGLRARQMLQGFPTKSLETGHQLWLLAQEARSVPELMRTLLATPAVELDAALARTAEGQAFARRWEAFLEAYGWRSGRFEFAEPTWYEDRSQPLTQLRAYLTAANPEDPEVSLRRQATEREVVVAEIEARVPEELRPQFRMMLAGAQTYIPIAEDHNFYIDQLSLSSFRVPVLALGQALARVGIIAEPEDVFYLTYEDLVAVGEGKTHTRGELVAERKRTLVHWRTLEAPEFLGTPPPADLPPDPIVSKFFGVGHQLISDARVIRGIGSSAGVVTGTVKVVRTLAEADKLEPGDVLVCHMTMPAWTPLFAVAGAVVADSGGVLSHCSIVAREYGIPCVTATRIGTKALRDGQRVTVDGTKGTVTIEE